MAADLVSINSVAGFSTSAFDRLELKFKAHGHRRAGAGELAAMLERIRSTFALPVASSETISAVDRVTRATAWLALDDGEPQGLNLWVPLSSRGERALREKRFDPANIAPEQIAAAGQRFAAVYHWGYCGFTRTARRSIMRLCAELLEGPLASIDVYGRVVTDAGAAAAARLGIEPCFELGADFYVHRARPLAHCAGDIR